ncbi:Gfo/Idh/MocA family oxidoreductase [Nonomuraea longicatena]|uniref:Gfo/Idh/MocA family oxidoreductase n=1 Tax=Nonomuraea longicatena TaxID=83682 RepID=A0ABP3Z2T2_9ACTN
MTGVAIVGAGVISAAYLRNLCMFPELRVVAVDDLDTDLAAAVAADFGVPVSGGLPRVLAVPEVELVVNLTVPSAHAEVGLAVLRAGKHVYGEKPLALDVDQGEKLLAEAAGLGLRVGAAPDTFLGAGLQSAARALRSGLIGTPVAVSVAMQSMGPERWHPSPEYLYGPGGGPLFDLGPYYLTALVALLGPAVRVAGSTRIAHAWREIGSGPKAGQSFPVRVATHVHALIDFASGANVSATFSFDSPVDRRRIEITGTEGVLSLPDPNTYGGPLLIRAPHAERWRELPVSGTTIGRGLGILDLARSIRAGTPHRASGTLALHVLEIMTAITASAEQGEFRRLRTTVSRPSPVTPHWPHA